MTLQFQNVSIPFAKGLDTKTDEKLVVQGKLVDLQNGVFTDGERIRKRPGFSNLGDKDIVTLAKLTNPKGLSTFDSELINYSNNSLHTYSLTSDAWINKGALTSIKVISKAVIDNNYTQSEQDMACNSNIQVIAWGDERGGIRYTVKDISTGSEYLTDVSVTSSGSRPRVVSSQSSIFIWYRDTTNLKYRKININSPTTLGSEKTAKADLNNSGEEHFDVISFGNDQLVAYNDTSNEVHLIYWITSTEVVGTLASGFGDEYTATGENGENCLTLYVLDPSMANPTIIVAYHNVTNGVRVFGRNKDLTQAFAAATLDSAVKTSTDTFVDGDVTVGSDNINLATHSFTENDRIQLTTSGTLPAGLALLTNYYVSVVDADNIKLSLTSGPGPIVDITAAAGGGTHTITDQDINITKITGAKTSDDTVTFWYQHRLALTDYHNKVRSNTVTNAGSIGTASIFMRSVGLGTKAFTVEDGVAYVGLLHVSTLQATYFIVDESGDTISRIFSLQSGDFNVLNSIPQVQNTSLSIYEFAGIKKGRLKIETSTYFNEAGVFSVSMNFDSKDAYASDSLGGSLLTGGGQITQYDGKSVSEYGFHVFPENLTNVTAASGGSMPDGVYLFKAVYEWVDSQGQRHRSAPSVPLSVTLSSGTSTETVTVIIPTLRITGKSNVTIHLYSTEDAGTIYYRDSSVSSPTFSDKSVDTIQITRTQTDANLIGNEILYTTGGVIENISPPDSHIVVTHRNRFYISGLQNGNQINYSKEFEEGEGVGFSDLFFRFVEQEGGDITQLGSMDDKLIIFKNSRIYFQTGNGPSITGLQNDFTEPQLITTDTGCTDSKSVVETPNGLMFKGDKGIYLLDRSLRVKYIGADVEKYNSEVITSAVPMDEVNEVRFTTKSSRALVYNYYYEEWSTFTNYSAISSVNWNGAYTHLISDGTVRKETKDQYTDNGKSIIMKIETAWLKLAGLQGYQRVRRMAILGEYRSEHQLQTSVFYDYEDFFRHLIVFNATSVVGSPKYGDDATYGDSTVYGASEVGGNNIYQMRAHMPRQKCQSIKFLFEDQVSGSNTGESFSLSDLTIEVGMKRGINKLSASKTL